MRLAALMLALSAFCAFGQAFTLQDTALLGNAIPTGVAANITPTNMPNATSISWWTGADYTTNSGPTRAYWPDKGPGGYTLTNLVGARFPTNGGTLGGHTILNFDSAYMASDNYTSSQPHTICMVLKSTVEDASGKYVFDSGNVGAREYFYTANNNDGPNKAWVLASGTFTRNMLTNVWMLVECSITNGATALYTNGIISGASGNGGTVNMWGISFATSYTRSGFNHAFPAGEPESVQPILGSLRHRCDP